MWLLNGNEASRKMQVQNIEFHPEIVTIKFNQIEKNLVLAKDDATHNDNGYKSVY